MILTGESVNGVDGASAAAPAQQKGRRHQRKPEQQGAEKVHHEESAAAVVDGEDGKRPDVAEPEGRPRRRENERAWGRPVSV